MFHNTPTCIQNKIGSMLCLYVHRDKTHYWQKNSEKFNNACPKFCFPSSMVKAIFLIAQSVYTLVHCALNWRRGLSPREKKKKKKTWHGIACHGLFDLLSPSVFLSKIWNLGEREHKSWRQDSIILNPEILKNLDTILSSLGSLVYQNFKGSTITLVKCLQLYIQHVQHNKSHDMGIGQSIGRLKILHLQN